MYAVHRQHEQLRRTADGREAGEGPGRDCAGGIHHSKQRRLDHVRQIPELTVTASSLLRPLRP